MAALFYEDEFHALNNFSALQVFYRGKLYPTSEHAYQASKFSHKPEIQEEIFLATSPLKAQQTAHKYKQDYHTDFKSQKVEIMREILKAKLEQHQEVVDALIKSKDEMIGENSPHDYFWGIGADGSGENWMGKLWMELRTELFNKE